MVVIMKNGNVGIRIFDTNKEGTAIYQYLSTGKVELVENGSVVFSATPERKANYNRIVCLSTGYLSSYVDRTTNIIEENDVKNLEVIE